MCWGRRRGGGGRGYRCCKINESIKIDTGVGVVESRKYGVA